MHIIKKYSIVLFLLFLVLFVGNINSVKSESEIYIETKGKVDQITEEEKSILEGLYLLEQGLLALNKREKELTKRITSKQYAINEIEEKIKVETAKYKSNQKGLEVVLVTYQKMGVTSIVEIVLDSDSLSSFISRLNIIKNLARDTDLLMKKIDNNRLRLESENKALAKNLSELEIEKKKLEQLITEQSNQKKEKEIYLHSLEERRVEYEGYLQEIEEDWSNLKKVFMTATKEFSELAETGALSEDDIEIHLSFLGAKVKIYDETFNRIIKEDTSLPDIVMIFEEGNTVIDIKAHNLLLNGNFELEEGDILDFKATSGTFHELKLSEETISELFEENDLILKIEKLLEGNIAQSVESHDGYMQLNVKLKLF